METVATHSLTPWSRITARVDVRAAAVWLLAGGLVLYLAVDGGGYDLIVRNQAGVVVWWMVIVGAAAGVLPVGRLGSLAWAGLALFGAFAIWTALASTWSISSERSLQELSRVACYLGVLILALAVHRDRESAMRHTIAAVGSAVAVVAGLAVLSRLRPDMFAGSGQTAAFLAGTHGRLAWPLNYWNGLAALMALGLPLLLAIATSARTLRSQALAAGAIPLTALCAYLTFSRGGALAAGAAVIVFVALAADRIPKLATMLVTAAGSAVLIAGAVHRDAIEKGLTNATAHDQGSTLLVAVVLVCVGVTVVQVGIGLAACHGTPPRMLQISPRTARIVLIAGLVAALAIALAAGAPSRLSHAWTDFKKPVATGLHTNSLGRFGVVNGNGRYQLWQVAGHVAGLHPARGSGPGTFQLLYQPRAPTADHVINAHSLYLETLDETGAVGLALLVGFFVVVIAAGIATIVRSRHETRTQAAGVIAAVVAFLFSAAVDWVWQIPALPVAVLLLSAAVLVPSRRAGLGGEERRRAGIGAIAVRVGMVVVGLLCLVAIGVPLATTNDVRQSQAAAAAGNTTLALADAVKAARVEPGASSPWLQEALVLEAQGKVPAAAAAAQRAIDNEPANWQNWLVLSRIDAERGDATGSVAAYRRARELYPRSLLFAPRPSQARTSARPRAAAARR
jgi:hypothetical protein